jgi:hypothetical protein
MRGNDVVLSTGLLWPSAATRPSPGPQPELPAHPGGENKSPRTIEAYTDAVRLLATHCQAHGHPLVAGELQRAHIQAFIADQLARWKPSTAHNRYRGLHAFFKWAVAEGDLEADPTCHIFLDALEKSADVLALCSGVEDPQGHLLVQCRWWFGMPGVINETAEDSAVLVRRFAPAPAAMGWLVGSPVDDARPPCCQVQPTVLVDVGQP